MDTRGTVHRYPLEDKERKIHFLLQPSFKYFKTCIKKQMCIQDLLEIVPGSLSGYKVCWMMLLSGNESFSIIAVKLNQIELNLTHILFRLDE